MTRYAILVRGSAVRDWKDWFREMEVQSSGEVGERQAELLFTGSLPDQSALLGVLMRLHNLNLTILSVQKIDERGKKTS